MWTNDLQGVLSPSLPYVTHSATSRAAAKALLSKANTLRSKVYRWLLDNGPASDETMQYALDMNPSTQRPRRIELVRMGLIQDSGLRGVTRSGRQATIWKPIT